MAFAYIGKALTPAEFAQYVASYDFGPIPPDYIVLHHTAIPATSWAPSGDPDDFWDEGDAQRSLSEMKTHRLNRLAGVKNYYQNSLGWDAGPHLWIDDTYIYLMTPMYDIGIHAMWGNSFHQNGKLHYSIGIEVVGNYTKAQWPPAVQANVRAAVQTLQQRLVTFTLDYMYADPASKPGRATKRVNGAIVEYCPHPERLRFGGLSSHRDYNKLACPGDAITEDFYLSVIRGTQAVPPVRPDLDERPTEDSMILAPPRCTQQQALNYMLARTHANYTSADISLVILPAYFAVCTSVGVDPCAAIAQMIHETGNLSSDWDARPHRNPAGIGVTGEPGKGLSFANWSNESIPAHVGRLLAYALPKGSGTPAQQALIGTALAFRSLPDSLRGSAPTLAPLGAKRNPTGQGWANPGDQYGAALARIMAAMQKS